MDPILEMYEVQAELIETKDELDKIRKEFEEFKNQVTVNVLRTVSEIQSKVDSISKTVEANQKTFTALSIKVSKNEEMLSEIKNIPSKENETIQALKNDIGNQLFSCFLWFQEKPSILLLGGQDGIDRDSLVMLGNTGQNWKQLNIKLPYGVWGHGAQFLNNNLYTFGGYNENHKQLNWTYKLSESLQWKKKADMNKKRGGISNSSVILGEQIWVCGGYNTVEGNLNSVEMYDPETNKWKYMREMNERRRDAAAAVVNRKIFCSEYNSVEYYDPLSDVWTIICNIPKYIQNYGAAEMDGNFIVIGGYAKDVWAWDTMNKNAVWIDKPSMSIPRNRFSIAKIDDKIFVCGGYDGSRNSNNVEIFDGEVWRNGPKMPTYRWLAPAVVIPIEFARSLK